MPKLQLLGFDGTEYEVHAEIGQSVMQAAMSAEVPGIIADCGGQCSCATCHGYVDAAWIDQLPKPTSDESDMLQCVLDPRDNSRLTCQIKVTPEMDGMVIRLPESQL